MHQFSLLMENMIRIMNLERTGKLEDNAPLTGKAAAAAARILYKGKKKNVKAR